MICWWMVFEDGRNGPVERLDHPAVRFFSHLNKPCKRISPIVAFLDGERLSSAFPVSGPHVANRTVPVRRQTRRTCKFSWQIVSKMLRFR